MDEKPTIFERIPVFTLAILGLLIATTAGIWIAASNASVSADDQYLKAKELKAAKRADDDDDDDDDGHSRSRGGGSKDSHSGKDSGSKGTKGTGSHDSDDSDDSDHTKPDGTYGKTKHTNKNDSKDDCTDDGNAGKGNDDC
jgi:hypothetical protein